MPALAADLDTFHIDSPLGTLAASASGRGLRSLRFLSNDPLAPVPPVDGAPGGDLCDPERPCAGPHLELLRRQIADYLAGSSAPFTVPLDPLGTPFQLGVWNALRTIPHGQTRSYADVARAIDRPDAVRAVAAANGDNPIAILIPCHRVIGSDGSLTGYAGGLWRKARLLKLEGTRPTLFP